MAERNLFTGPQPGEASFRADVPLLVFDGDCGFCRAWVDIWRRRTGDRVNYAPYQQVAAGFPGIPRQDFAVAVKLMMPDGTVYSGAHAVFVLLSLVPGKRRWLWWYERVPGFATISEFAYRVIAAHRSLAYKITNLMGLTKERER